MKQNSILSTGRLGDIADAVESLFIPSPSRSYFHHTLRVAGYTTRIANNEGLNTELLTAAALVHDVGMVHDPSFRGHVTQTGIMAPSILKQCGFSDQEAEEIVTVAISHHPQNGHTLTDPNERVLFDADNLDIIGVFGLLRWFGEVPGDIQDLSSSATLFKDMVTTACDSRGDFFYTRIAQDLGDTQLKESYKLCESLIRFVEEFQSDPSQSSPISFAKALDT